MARRRGLGEAPLRVGGYPSLSTASSSSRARTLKDGQGRTIGHGHVVNCTKIRPGAPGSWISNERCSYQFMIGGAAYSCRGYGEGMAASCRRMKTIPKGLSGARRRR